MKLKQNEELWNSQENPMPYDLGRLNIKNSLKRERGKEREGRKEELIQV